MQVRSAEKSESSDLTAVLGIETEQDLSEAPTTQVSDPLLLCGEEGSVATEVTDSKSSAGATSSTEEPSVVTENGDHTMKGPAEVPSEASTATTDQVDTTGEGTSED